MLIRRARLLRLFLATVLVTLCCGCGGPEWSQETSSPDPSEANGLTLEWCPAEGELRWSFDFSVGAEEAPDGEPLPWPGGMGFTMLGHRQGMGGGRGVAHCGTCGGSRPCGLSPEQQQAQRWRISESVAADFVPYNFSLRISPLPGQQRSHLNPGSPLLQARFELGPPEESGEGECLQVPVDSVSLTHLPAEAELD